MYRNDVFLSQLKIIFDTLLENGKVEKLSDNCELSGGFAFKSTEYKSEGSFVLRVTNIKPNGTIDTSDAKYISNESGVDYGNYFLEAGDVLIVMIGGSIGKVGFVDKTVLPALLNQNMWLVRSKNGLSSRYIFFLCLFLCQFHATEKNTSYGFYSRGKFRDLLVPSITPENSVILSELFDQILLEKNIDKNSLISVNSVNQINLLSHVSTHQSEISNEISNQQTYLTKLRQAILQEAIEGKLTADWRVKNPVQKGNPDHDAQALLETIKAEKQKLIAEGIIKKEKPLVPINPDDVPFALPDGWVWVRLGDTVDLITKGSSPNWQGVQYVEKGNGIRFITSKNVDSYKLNLKNETFVHSKFNEIEPRSILAYGDILTNIVGASIGRTAIYDLNDIANINQAVCLIRYQHNFVDKNFFLHFMNSPWLIKKMHDDEFSTGRANLSMANVANFPFPLPPLAEQNAIVERVDRLLESINALEQHVTERKRYAEQLMQAVLKEAFAG